MRLVIAPHGHIVTLDAFFEGARPLRKELDSRLSDARDPFDPGRFAWEPWHIDGQFSQARTPARSFFTGSTFAAFERRLLAWAGLSLGLSRLGGPPWLSSLVDGGFQALHRDSPNGEFAFSFGLSRGRGFRGGETQIASFDLLDYFRRGGHTNERAASPLFEEIPSRFNKLVVFDARLPHAVRMVQGPRHVRDGRVAIQGWLSADGCIARAGADVTPLAADVVALASRRARGVAGLLSVRVAGGKARSVCDTLVDTGARPARDELVHALEQALARAPFPKGTDVVIPILVDERGGRVPSGEPAKGRGGRAPRVASHARPARGEVASPS